MNRDKDVLIVLEFSGDDRQAINEGLISEGRKISGRLGGRLAALAFESISETDSLLTAFGLSTLYLLKGDLKKYGSEILSRTLAEFLLKNPPRLLLVADSDTGRELAPRVAFFLESAAVIGCTDIQVLRGNIVFTKPVYEGQFEQQVTFSPGLVEIATIKPEVLDRQKPSETTSSLEVREVYMDVPVEVASCTTNLELIAPDCKTVDIVQAKRVIGVGMGAAEAETLRLIGQLAELLEGSLGTTRPVADEGHLPKERLIGQTGKFINPDFYLALGISGSPHHVAGIQDSGKIISINKDPGAPIMQFSDVGFVGDLRRIIPKLLNRIREWKDSTSDEE